MEQLFGKMILYIYYDQKIHQCVVVLSDLQMLMYSCSTIVFIKRLCRIYGTNYEYQKAMSKHALQARQKVPIAIKESKSFLLFPLANTKKKRVFWINYGAIVRVRHHFTSFTVIDFINHQCFCVRSNIRMIQKQSKRCEKLMLFLETL